MKAVPPLSSSETTRAALLRAAAEVFAEQGYQLARVRDIALRAGVNLAAMNYHFGSKEKLYLAVLQSLAAERLSAFPLPDAAPTRGGRQRLLRFAIRNLLGRFLATEAPSLLPRLLVRELANPTPALQTLIETVARPQFALLQGVLRSFLGAQADAQQLRLAAFSILGQCLFYLFARPVASQLDPALYAGDHSLDRLADHIARFSAAGLLAQRQRGAGASHA
ncbi:MAG: CerR family C-terminal domain-containing protein [Nevskiales bacterium]